MAGICWFDDPYILFALMLFKLLVVVIEIAEFVRQNVSVWTEVKSILAEPLLKPDNIEAETVLARDLVALREVIDLLVLVEPLILVALARA